MQNSKQCPTCWECISPYFVAAQSSMSAWPASSACQPSQAGSAQPVQSSQPSRKLRQPAQRHRTAQPKQPASLDTKAMQPALAPEGWCSPWSLHGLPIASGANTPMGLRIRSKPGAGSYHSWWSLRMRQQLVVISGQRIYHGAPEAVKAGGPDGALVELL